MTDFLYLVLHLPCKVTCYFQLISSILVSLLRTSINVLSKSKSRNCVTWIANLTKLFLSVRAFQGLTVAEKLLHCFTMLSYMLHICMIVTKCWHTEKVAACLYILLNLLEFITEIMCWILSPTYAVFTTVDPTTMIFGLCTSKWGGFALVGGTLQSHQSEFCVTRFISTSKIRVRRGPSVFIKIPEP